MELRKYIFLFLILLLMIIFLISFSTKGAHWDQVTHKSGAETTYPQVYRSLEGLITLDVMLFSLCVPTLIFFHKQKVFILKYLMLLIFFLLLIRFIMSVIFLAGNDNYCWTNIQDYENMDPRVRAIYGEPNFYSTLEIAWGFEIFTIIAADLLGGFVLIFISREIKGSAETMRV